MSMECIMSIISEAHLSEHVKGELTSSPLLDEMRPSGQSTLYLVTL